MTKSKKINYSIIEEDLIKYYYKTYQKHITKDFFIRTPRELGLDSLDAVEMLLWAEEKYGIETENSDYSDRQTLQSFIDTVYNKIPKSRRA
jgi:acyl carrier protein